MGAGAGLVVEMAGSSRIRSHEWFRESVTSLGNRLEVA